MNALVPQRASAVEIVQAATLENVQPRRATLAHVVPLFLAWFRDTRGRSENTIVGYAFDLQSFLTYTSARGLRYLDEIDHRVIEAYLAAVRRERDLKPQTVSRHLSALKQLWIYCMREGFARSNPAAVSFSPKIPPRRAPKFIGGSSYDHVLTTLAAGTSLLERRDYTVVATFLLAGLRVNELVHLRLSDVDLSEPERGHGQLYVASGKGDRERHVTAPPRLVAILRDYLASVRPALVGRAPATTTKRRGDCWVVRAWTHGRNVQRHFRTEADAQAWRAETFAIPPDAGWLFVPANPLFTYRADRLGQPLVTRAVNARIARTVSAIVGRHVWPHLLRHSYAVRLRARGAPLEMIMEELGHADIRTTLVYAHMVPAERQTKIAELLG